MESVRKKEEQGLHNLFELRERKYVLEVITACRLRRNFKRPEAGCPALRSGFLPGRKAASPTCIR